MSTRNRSNDARAARPGAPGLPRARAWPRRARCKRGRRDDRLDLALLDIVGAQRAPGDVARLVPLALGDSSDLQVGEWLVVLGDPFGDDVTAAVGVVSATGREGAGSLAAGKVMGYRTF